MLESRRSVDALVYRGTESGFEVSVKFTRISAVCSHDLGSQKVHDNAVLVRLTANGLIDCYHERGSDELANRALKDFGHEQLPFKRFAPTAAWYYTMLVGHFLLELFKEDVGSHASTVRK